MGDAEPGVAKAVPPGTEGEGPGNRRRCLEGEADRLFRGGGVLAHESAQEGGRPRSPKGLLQHDVCVRVGELGELVAHGGPELSEV